MILMLLVLGIAFLILGIAGGIRYIEVLVATLLAPISAISIVRSGEGLEVWVRETTAIVFTQCIHILLLKILMGIMGSVSGIMMVVLSVGTIAVMLRGPQILRKFLYSSGTGSATVNMAGSGSRLAAMKYVLSSAKAM